MADPINIGDVVQLKSGGPKMTVTDVGDIRGQPTVWCVWFDKDEEKRGYFHPDALEPA